jgi:aspartyl-tRNA(Asn)/glutamyl-tRNA(Gln) amidotransferase subunit B
MKVLSILTDAHWIDPLAKYGKVKIGDAGSGRVFDVGIQQLQVEQVSFTSSSMEYWLIQDTAKSQVAAGRRLVDLNRAGTGLMEIVTDPDMRLASKLLSGEEAEKAYRSAEEAGMFVKRLQGLLRRLGSGDGDMEKVNPLHVGIHGRDSNTVSRGTYE